MHSQALCKPIEDFPRWASFLQNGLLISGGVGTEHIGLEDNP